MLKRACTYGNTVDNETGELALNFGGLLPGGRGRHQPGSVNSDAAPDIYNSENHVALAEALRQIGLGRSASLPSTRPRWHWKAARGFPLAQARAPARPSTLAILRVSVFSGFER